MEEQSSRLLLAIALSLLVLTAYQMLFAPKPVRRSAAAPAPASASPPPPSRPSVGRLRPRGLTRCCMSRFSMR